LGAAPPRQGPEDIETTPPTLDVGFAGGGALREYERRKAKDEAARAERSRLWRALNSFFYPDGRQSTHAWKVGAAGEERVAQALTALVDAGHGYALHDRRVPGKRSNIDHLFVGAAGVYVIDAKRYKGADISVERTGGLFSPIVETLKVGGRRKNDLVDAVVRQCDVVREVMGSSGHADVPVVAALCFVEAYLPVRDKNRRVKGVRLCSPKGLAALVSADGAFDDELRFAIAMELSTGLPSMT
jgi:Nuclease-related domain